MNFYVEDNIFNLIQTKSIKQFLLDNSIIFEKHRYLLKRYGEKYSFCIIKQNPSLKLDYIKYLRITDTYLKISETYHLIIFSHTDELQALKATYKLEYNFNMIDKDIKFAIIEADLTMKDIEILKKGFNLFNLYVDRYDIVYSYNYD